MTMHYVNSLTTNIKLVRKGQTSDAILNL